jgi:hypothetical protein
MDTTLNIINTRLNDVIIKLEKLNRKSSSLGLSSVNYTLGSTFVEEIELEMPSGQTRKVFVERTPVTISAEIIKINGWTLQAAIDSAFVDGKNFNFISGPKSEEFKHLRTVQLTCEHCGVNRYRKHHYVVQHENGTTKIVGSSCLKDFLGTDPARAVASYAIFHSIISFKEDDEKEYFKGSYAYSFKLSEVINQTLAVLRVEGRYFNRESGTITTAETVFQNLKGGLLKDCQINIIKEDVEAGLEVFKSWNQSAQQIEENGHESASDIEFKKYLWIRQGYVSTEPRFINPCVGFIYGTWVSIQRKSKS